MALLAASMVTLFSCASQQASYNNLDDQLVAKLKSKKKLGQKVLRLLAKSNYSEAYAYALDEANNNNIDAFIILGKLNETGVAIIARDLEASANWYEKAANSNNAEAMNDLSYLLFKYGDDNALLNSVKWGRKVKMQYWMSLQEQSAELDYLPAMLKVCVMYANPALKPPLRLYKLGLEMCGKSMQALNNLPENDVVLKQRSIVAEIIKRNTAR